MTGTSENRLARCTLCPALCGLGLDWDGPDRPRVAYPAQAGTGLCPRGSALGDLLAAPSRIRWPRQRRDGGAIDVKLNGAIAAAAERMAGGATVLIDAASLPIEQIVAAADIVAVWEGVRLCAVLAPEDEQVLMGVEASGATYLADEDLAGCDGFLIIGNAFAGNPRCARGVLDARKGNPRVPTVVIDSGGGVPESFASLRVPCPAGGELDALQSEQVASAVEGCRKLGVIIAAEAGRGGRWARVGFLAGRLANAQGGGVAVQTAGANALAALRLRVSLGMVSLAEAMTPAAGDEVRVAIGVDVLGLLGWAGPPVAIAAAAAPNQTTATAELILPTALPCEMGGTFIQAGTKPVTSAALLAPPAGVPTPAELLGLLAAAAGVRVPQSDTKPAVPERLAAPEPPEVAAPAIDQSALVAAREALHHADGALTAQAGWQSQLQPVPELRVSPRDAEALGVGDLADVEVETESYRTAARVRVVEYISPGTLAISEGDPRARRLLSYVIDADRDVLVSRPGVVAVRRAAR